MSWYRNIKRARFDDERIEQLSPIAKHVFDYLCCSPQDDLTGLYRLRLSLAEEHLGWTREQITEALREIGSVKGMDGSARPLAKWDEKSGVVWVVNMFRHACGGKGIGKKHADHARKQIDALPASFLKDEFRQFYTELGIGCATLSEPCASACEPSHPTPTPTPTRYPTRNRNPTRDPGGDDPPPTPRGPPGKSPAWNPDRDRAEAARIARTKLHEALTHGTASGVPPPAPPKAANGRARRQLVPGELAGQMLVERWEQGENLDAVIDQVLGDLEAWARLADRGLVNADAWAANKLLTSTGSRRLVAEVEAGGDPKHKPDPSRGSFRPDEHTDYGPIGEQEIT